MAKTVASGRFVLRISEDLHGQLQRQAKASSVSLNALCGRLLEGAIIAKPTENPLLQSLKTEFKTDLLAVLLFGSQVQGRATESSDEDWLVILKNQIPIDRGLYRERHREIEKKVSLHFSHLPSIESRVGSLWLEVALAHQILFKSSDEVSFRLTQIREAILNGVYRRRLSHGHPYWTHEEQK